MTAGNENIRHLLQDDHRMVIDGAFVESLSRKTLPVENPATGKVIAHVPAGNADDAARAVNAARSNFDSGAWRNQSPEERASSLWNLADLLTTHAEELAHLDVLDNGMPLRAARNAVQNAANGMRFFAGMCTKLHGRTAKIGSGQEFHAFSTLEPVGVVGLITPWNVPITSACGKLAPALSAGCSVVLKPAEQTPLSALRIGALALEAGIPPGTVNVVTGTGIDAGQPLVEHPHVNKISFTGSTSVGKNIIAACAGNLKRVTLELGGKSPVFIFPDANLETTIPLVAMGIFANSGQSCIAGSRLYVQSDIYEEVVTELTKFAEALELGNGFEPSTQLGPLISERQRQRVLDFVAAGCRDGAELLTGGKATGAEGYFIEPTILANVPPQHRVAREEIFGPVLTVMTFDGLEDLAKKGNDSSYGLGAGIFTNNLGVAHRAASLLEAGSVWINCYGKTDKSLPFGGFKQSGWGRENGLEGVESFMEKKSVYIKI